MTRKVYGIYQSEEEAVTAVSGLELKGYKAKNITIFTNLNNPNTLESQTDVKVESSLSQEDNTVSFMDKVKRIFTNDPEPELDIYEKLVSLGIPKEQADKCIADVEAGKILVIADDELRMGHAPPIKPLTSKEVNDQADTAT